MSQSGQTTMAPDLLVHGQQFSRFERKLENILDRLYDVDDRVFLVAHIDIETAIVCGLVGTPAEVVQKVIVYVADVEQKKTK
jgi:hypothetical protein